jgi:myo-inositol-hexaphosphate 3-phosphohydrolase
MKRILTELLAAVLLTGALVPAGTARAVEILPVDMELVGNGINYDDICFWRDPANADDSLVFVTSKDAPAVEVFRLVTGEFLASITDFEEPNNCDVTGNLLVTTDRIAQDVAVHSIPDFGLVARFGSGFSQPEGVTVLHTDGVPLAYVTNKNDEAQVYELDTFQFVLAFDTGFSKQEGIAADDLYQRLYINNDNTGHTRWFTPSGELIQDFNSPATGSDAEGVTLYRCGSGGWIIVSDQRPTDPASEYEIFDRNTFAHIGTFSLQDAGGNFTNATDGIDVFQTPTSTFPSGVFAACDDCANTGDDVDLVGWERVAAAFGLAICPDGVPPTCGNSITDANEECDGADDGACPTLCTLGCLCGEAPPICGDDMINQIGEECDGADGATCPGLCGPTCQCPPACGDELADGEPCDDGESCTFDDVCIGALCIGARSCGNGAVDAACGETCEAGQPGACTNGCLPPGAAGQCTCAPPPHCGDDLINQATEECDGAHSPDCPGACTTGCVCGPPLADIEADASVIATSANTSFGTTAILDADASSAKRSLFRIGITGIGNRLVTGATLHLHVASASNAESDSGGQVHALPDCGWDETTVTWNNQPSPGGVLTAPAGAVAIGGMVSFDVTSAVTTDGTYCFVLDSPSSNGVKYNAREAAAGGPALDLTIASGVTTTTTSTTSTTTSTTSTTNTGPPSTTTTTASPATTTSTTTTTTTTPTTSSTSTTTTTMPSSTVSLSIQIAAGNDDAEEHSSGAVNTGSSDLELTYDKASQQVGMRFGGVDIPRGATIVHAYLQFQVDETPTPSHPADLTVWGQASGDAAPFTTANGNISSRPKTSTSVAWSPAAWDTVGNAGPLQQTKNISAVIEEIVGHGEWAAGQALALIITGTTAAKSDSRIAESYDGSPGGAATLHIEYLPLPAGTTTTTNAEPTTSTTSSTTSTTTTTSTSTTTTTRAGDGVVTEILADTKTESSNPGTNFGWGPELSADASSEKHTFLRVRVSGIGTRTVTGARLMLAVAEVKRADSNSGGRIQRISDCAWDEATVSFNDEPALDGTPGPDVGPVARGQMVEFDVSEHVTADGTYCFAITSDSSNGVDYEAREAGGDTPQLDVEVAP